jgi:hypothetical protein
MICEILTLAVNKYKLNYLIDDKVTKGHIYCER